MNPIRTAIYHVYLLQLENYDIVRCWQVILKRPFFSGAWRQKIVWTPKLVLVAALAGILKLAVIVSLLLNLGWSVIALVGFVVLDFIFLNSFFIFLTLAVFGLWPIDYVVKRYIINRAKTRIRRFEIGRVYNDRDTSVYSREGLKVIGITGSYGKTTMKEVLGVILAEKFRVLKTPDSVNTPVGIARLVLADLKKKIDVFIVEMGAYHRGDIKALCEITRPDIAVLTGINEAHLERFGSIENTIKAKFEIAENARASALVMMNGDDERVKENYKKFIGGKRFKFYDSHISERPLNIPILGDYIWGVVNACVIIGKELGMTDEEIGRGMRNIKPIPHRLQKIENPNGITVIDDSYNGNPDGVREAIKVLSKFEGRRKIYITPGLVEGGQKVTEIHNQIGVQLNPVADVVILIKNSVTPFIADKLDPKKVIWFDSASVAHNSLENILKPGDVILFQNDWPDNYL